MATSRLQLKTAVITSAWATADSVGQNVADCIPAMRLATAAIARAATRIVAGDFHRRSTGGGAGILDTMQLRGFITAAQYSEARALLLRVVQMLSRLCGVPRVVRRP